MQTLHYTKYGLPLSKHHLFQHRQHMLYRLTRGCGMSIHDTWTSDDALNPDDTSLQSVSLEPAGVYKSRIATNQYWGQFSKV